MRSHEIRKSFVDFFVERGHQAFPSAPLVPHGDPTLMFTNAGMVQFKDFFLGNHAPPSARAVSVQKCLRVSGKHNDLENVGPSPRHHTFFEMLGNFSFGDYFKAEAIEFGWDLVTRVWGLPPERLSATVYEQDDEAADLWAAISGLPVERIHRCGHKDNFWAMGETGPCGPCSEIFVDVYPDLPAVDWHEGSESGRYLEIWNLVFMQYSRDDSGEMVELPNPSIDTGAGLERVAAVLQGVESNYDSDLFLPLLDAAAELAGRRYGRSEVDDVSLRVVADHLRAVAFLLADGVIPGNEGRGYVLRRLLRRAVRHGMRVGFEEPFLYRLLPVLGEVLDAEYPELDKTRKASVESVTVEEEKFLSTVALASRQVQEAIDAARAEGSTILPGTDVFRFYDTYGLPYEIIEEIAEEERFGVDRAGFETALAEQRQRSRSSGAASRQRTRIVSDQVASAKLPVTPFVGYEQMEKSDAVVSLLVTADETETRTVERLGAGESGVVVLEQTPFYAESGGQVGDRGGFFWDGGSATVEDTQKTPGGVILHQVRVEKGALTSRSTVSAEVDRSLRARTQRNHTATHLLHAALRHVLGTNVRQAGSLVAPDRLRFDFTHPHPVEEGQLRRVEDLVNRWILAAEAAEIVPSRPFQEAVDAGAMALFGEKYGDSVRTVEIPALPLGSDGTALSSLELCGGCHVGNTGEIGLFLISSERGVASGVRRIEALTGEGALEHLRHQRALLRSSADRLGVEPEQTIAEIDKLTQRVRTLEDELSQLRLQVVAGRSEADEIDQVDGIRVLRREVPAAPPGELRTMADVFRSRLGSGVVVLGSRGEGKVTLIAAVTDDLLDRVHAGKLVQRIAEIVDGSGGGRSDFAQAGGRDPESLGDALAAVSAAVRDQLAASE